ncbi:hypothetical protein SAMN05445756_1889 [Kytococcus aerolatus]|uniref:GerMN domain-containing protein n=1 Tax=Kytococcus aerolatus TaxID=592308 RepID=A0A212U4U9_9MICO|nr:hypothetical protein [Kytococcus aerolatus]SNC73288.1 hypothetical protein SAMN05445756_1889 [Kytococcus aerolatus]
MRRTSVLLAVAGLVLLTACGSGVDEGQVEEFEAWARDQPGVEAVDSEVREKPDRLFGGTRPVALTTLHFAPGTSDGEVLAVSDGMGAARPAGEEPADVVGERDGVTFLLSSDEADDRRTLRTVSALEAAAPDAQPVEPGESQVAMVTSSRVSLLVPDAEIDQVAREQVAQLDRALRSVQGGVTVGCELSASAVGGDEPVGLSFDTATVPAGQVEAVVDAIDELPDPWEALGVTVTQARREAYLVVPGEDVTPSDEHVALVTEGDVPLSQYVDSYYLNGVPDEDGGVPGVRVPAGPTGR